MDGECSEVKKPGSFSEQKSDSNIFNDANSRDDIKVPKFTSRGEFGRTGMCDSIRPTLDTNKIQNL